MLFYAKMFKFVFLEKYLYPAINDFVFVQYKTHVREMFKTLIVQTAGYSERTKNKIFLHS